MQNDSLSYGVESIHTAATESTLCLFNFLPSSNQTPQGSRSGVIPFFYLMARITTALSADDLSRLIDGLEGTAHLDVEPIDRDRTDQLLCRLINLFDQVMAEELQPLETSEFHHTVEELTNLVFN